MTRLYPIVLEMGDSGAVSVYVPGLPVYAAAETHAKAERAIRALLTEYLKAHPATRPDARVRVARFSDVGKRQVDIVGVAALVGARRSTTKARASRRNGRLGGRPRTAGVAARRRAKASRWRASRCPALTSRNGARGLKVDGSKTMRTRAAFGRVPARLTAARSRQDHDGALGVRGER